VALMLDAVARAGAATPTVAQVKAMLAASTRPFPVTPEVSVGSGILDAQAAVATALGVTLPPQVTALVQGRMSAPQQRAVGGSSLFSLDVPAGARNLVIRSVGGTGDASLFVKAGSIPADNGSDADARSAHPGNAESVVLARPVATTYYVRLAAAKDFSKVTVLATYVSP
jgi:serine protease